jgi:ELWxxDGT repeat protein
MVADINPSGDSSPADLTVFNNELYFQADDGSSGQELWKYDGTGVSMLLDISPGSADGVPDDGMVIVGNALYFAGDDGFNGEDLWSTDGTGLGYTVVTYS